MKSKLNRYLIYLFIILFTLISQRIVYNIVFYPFEDKKIHETEMILKGNMDAPFQYRILKPIIYSLLDNSLSSSIQNEHTRFEIIIKVMLIIGFFFIYLIFFYFLKIFYTDIISLIGLMLLQIVIPLSTTSNMWEEGDYITLFIYLMSFYLMFKEKDLWIPLIIAVGSLNREQTLYILIFYIAFLYEQKKIFKLKSTLIIISSIVLYILIFIFTRQYFGYKENTYTLQVAPLNISHISILRLWFEQIFVFFFLSFLAYKKSRLFFKIALLALIPYTVFYFFLGVMGELGKYMPAYLIMITICLQLFSEEPADLITQKTKLSKSLTELKEVL